jgi:hypothetical protein
MWMQYRTPGTFTVTNANAATDLFLLRPADDKPCRLVGWSIGQNSEVADAQEEGVAISVRHMAATLTVTGGTTVTEAPTHPGTGGATSATDSVYHATETTTSGTSTVMEYHGWNLRNTPWQHWIPEELRPEAKDGEGLIVRCETTLADDVVFYCTFYWEEWQ